MKLRWLMLLCAALLICAAGCATQTRTPPVRIAVVLYRQDDVFLSSVTEQIERLKKDREKADGRAISLNIVDSQNNQSVQNSLIDRIVARGCGVLCVNMVDRTSAAIIVEKARAAEIPLIFFNREPTGADMSRWSKTYYVGADAAQSGKMQGQIVAAAWRRAAASVDQNGDGVLQYAILEGEPGHQDALLRTKYSIREIAAAGIPMEKVAGGTANWQRGEASGKTAQWIGAQGRRIELILSNNDDMALGALDAYRGAGIDAPLVVGVDGIAPALEAVDGRHMLGTVVNDAGAQAKAIFTLAYALATGGDPAAAGSFEDGRYIRLPYRIYAKDAP